MIIFEKYKDLKNRNINLKFKEFASTSLNREIAFSFMFRGLSKDDVPVLFQINNLREDGENYFNLDSSDYSLFTYEQEVLLAKGRYLKIIEISE